MRRRQPRHRRLPPVVVDEIRRDVVTARIDDGAPADHVGIACILCGASGRVAPDRTPDADQSVMCVECVLEVMAAVMTVITTTRATLVAVVDTPHLAGTVCFGVGLRGHGETCQRNLGPDGGLAHFAGKPRTGIPLCRTCIDAYPRPLS